VPLLVTGGPVQLETWRRELAGLVGDKKGVTGRVARSTANTAATGEQATRGLLCRD